MSTYQHTVDLICAHISDKLSGQSRKPLFVALQGPQGSGKTFLTRHIHTKLSHEPLSLRVAIVSIDDLYLTHDELVSLSLRYPDNPLWKGRGQPGTHDVKLAVQIFKQLQAGQAPVEIPRFDKSLFNGEGDRLPLDGSGPIVTPPLDIIILEGWCVGFYPISMTQLDSIWNASWNDERNRLSLSQDVTGVKQNIIQINEKLKEYVELWDFCQAFVQIVPSAQEESKSAYSVIYKWRLEQEHNMKAVNGGKGMTDNEVKLFIDRYIPGYVFFGDGVTEGWHDPDSASGFRPPPWKDNGLRVFIDKNRTLVRSSHF